LFLSRILSSGLAYIGLFFITRYLGTDIYGTVTWTMAFVATFNAVSDLGFNSAHIKRMSEGCDPNQCISTFAFVKLILTGFMVALTLTSVYIWTSLMGNTLTDTSIEIIGLFIVFQVLFDLSSIATVTFQARMEMAKMPLATLADPMVRVPIIIIVSLSYMSVRELSMAYVFGAVALLLVSMLLLLRDRIKWTRPVLLRSYFTFALPLMVITIISTISGNMDKLIIGFFWESSDVGLYSAPAVFLGVFATVSTAVSALTFPSFSKLHTEGNLAEIRALSRQAERYIAMIGIPITILIMIFPYEVCEVLLGPKFIDSGRVIGIMAVTNFITMINAVHNSQIVAVGRPDISARITVLTVSINFGLMMLLIPDTGLGLSYVGAALAVMTGNIVGLIAIRYVVWRLTRTDMNYRLALQIVAGVASAVAMYLLGQFLIIDRWYTLVLFGVVAFISFLGVLTLMKEFTRKDIDYFLELVNLRKMLSYIKGELKGK